MVVQGFVFARNHFQSAPTKFVLSLGYDGGSYGVSFQSHIDCQNIGL